MRARRRHLGLSQTQLGDYVGITYQQIQKYESGRNKLSPARLLQITRCLAVTPEWLFGTDVLKGVAGDAPDHHASQSDTRDLMSAFSCIANSSLRSLVIEFVENLTQRPEIASRAYPTRARELRTLLKRTRRSRSRKSQDVADGEATASASN